ncbi:MAG: hypothetical protein HYS56_01040 [Candidatus Omnitrophica bacterium]|nr:hypothetical protein [Candidatus Omnitrophota bacterium]
MTCCRQKWGRILFSVVWACNVSFLISLHHCVLPESSEQKSGSELLVDPSTQTPPMGGVFAQDSARRAVKKGTAGMPAGLHDNAAPQSTALAIRANVFKEKKHCASIHAILPRLEGGAGLKTKPANRLQLANQLRVGISLKNTTSIPGKDSGPPSVEKIPKELFYITTFPNHAPPALSA